MEDLLACLCCCCYTKEVTPPSKPRRQPNKKKKKVKAPREVRVKTKYRKEDFVLVSDEERHEKRVKAYCCPICTLYYTKIFACSECVNFICWNCLEGYEKKMRSNKEKLKCPFCNSEKTIFCDYELDPHSYFDTTNKGFLSKQQRQKMQSQSNFPSEQVKIEGENEQSEQQEEGRQ